MCRSVKGKGINDMIEGRREAAFSVSGVVWVFL